MEDYRIDKVQVYADQESRAVSKIQQMEDETNLQPITFIKKSFEFAKLRERKTEPEFGILLGVTLAKICALAGIKSEIDNLVKQDLTRMIFTSFSDLSLEEIYKAFELERFSVYETKSDHYNLFNADYVSSVLKKFKEWRQQMKRTHYISPPKQITEMTDSEKKQIIDNGIIRKYNEYSETNSIEEPFVYIFDELIERNVIKSRGENTPALDQYYQNKINQAHLEITTELKNFTSADKSERNSVKSELEKVINGTSNKVEIRAKRIILVEFFSKVKNSGEPIEKTIK